MPSDYGPSCTVLGAVPVVPFTVHAQGRVATSSRTDLRLGEGSSPGQSRKGGKNVSSKQQRGCRCRGQCRGQQKRVIKLVMYVWFHSVNSSELCFDTLRIIHVSAHAHAPPPHTTSHPSPQPSLTSKIGPRQEGGNTGAHSCEESAKNVFI